MVKKYFSRIPGTFWAAAGCFLLGVLIYFGLYGYSFSAFICFGIGGILCAYGILKLCSGKHPKAVRILRQVLTCCVCAGVLIAGVTGCFIASSTGGDPDAECSYVIVLGAGVNGTVPSLSLRERLDATEAYLRAHPDCVAVVSGCQGDGEDISEAECMFRELTQAGIEPERVWMEDRATNTRENIRFSLDVIEERTGQRPDSAGIVSSEYHLYRAGLFAKEQGLQSTGIPARTSWFSLRLNYFLREIAAVLYYTILGG